MAMAGATTPNRRRTAQKPPQKDVWLFGSKQQREEAIDDIVRQLPDVRGRLTRTRAAERKRARDARKAQLLFEAWARKNEFARRWWNYCTRRAPIG